MPGLPNCYNQIVCCEFVLETIPAEWLWCPRKVWAQIGTRRQSWTYGGNSPSKTSFNHMTIVFFYTSTLESHRLQKLQITWGSVCPAPFKANGWIREEAKPIEKQHQVANYLGQIP